MNSVGGEFAIRAMVDGDIEELSVVGERTFRQTFQDDPDHNETNMDLFVRQCYSPAALREEFADPRLTFLLAVARPASQGVRGAIIGYAKVRRSEAPSCVTGEKPLELGQLYVDFAWHGRGVAHALMERCVDLAKSEGFRTMWLGVWHRNIRAQKFYRKWGFAWCGQYPFQFGNASQKDEVMMRAV